MNLPKHINLTIEHLPPLTGWWSPYRWIAKRSQDVT